MLGNVGLCANWRPNVDAHEKEVIQPLGPVKEPLSV